MPNVDQSNSVWPPVCEFHTRWTCWCSQCDNVRRQRIMIRLESNRCSAGDEDWIIDPNLT